jgi:hypothetical protein
MAREQESLLCLLFVHGQSYLLQKEKQIKCQNLLLGIWPVHNGLELPVTSPS